MEKSLFHEKIEERIAVCKEGCEKDKDDTFMSYVWHSELDTLQFLYERIREEEPTDELRDKLERRLSELEEAKELELEHPTFDWYDEHYHHKMLVGQCDAYRSVIKILDTEGNN